MLFQLPPHWLQLPCVGLLVGLFAGVPVVAQVAVSPSVEKLWEGRYVRLKDGMELPGSRQSWGVWREPNSGYVLESQFLIANEGALLAVLLGEAGAQMDPEYRREVEKEVAQQELVVRFDQYLAIQTVEIKGKRLADGESVVVAACKRTATEIQCRGANGRSKLKADHETMLLLSFPFPMLLAPHILQAEKSPERKVVFKVGFLEIVNGAPVLQEAEARLEFQRDEPVKIGDRAFNSGRYLLVVEDKGARLLETVVWASKSGLVLAIENEKQFPGEQIALVEYKPHAPFP